MSSSPESSVLCSSRLVTSRSSLVPPNRPGVLGPTRYRLRPFACCEDEVDTSLVQNAARGCRSLLLALAQATRIYDPRELSEAHSDERLPWVGHFAPPYPLSPHASDR